MGRRAIAIASVVVCAAVTGVAVASPVGGSGSRFTLAQAAFFAGYQLGIDRAGAATVVFSEQKVIDGTAFQVIYAREQRAAHEWTPAAQLGGPAQYSAPALAEARSGAAVMVVAATQQSLTDPSQQHTVIESFMRASATADWSGPATLWTGTRSSTTLASPPTVQIDSAGVATVVWSAGARAHPAIWTSTVDPRAGTTTRGTQLVAADQGGTNLRLAVSPAGAAVISWQHQDFRSTERGGVVVHASELAAYRSVAGSWASPRRLGRFLVQGVGAGAQIWAPASPTVAIAGNGDAVTAWIAGPGGNTGTPLMVAGYNAGTGRWTNRHVLSTDPVAFGVAAAGKSSFVAVWDTGPRATVMTATTQHGTAWSSARHLPGYNGPGDYSEYLASDPTTGITLVMTGRHSAIVYLTRKPDGTWTSVKTAGTGISPEVAGAGSRFTTIVWEQVRRSGDLFEATTNADTGQRIASPSAARCSPTALQFESRGPLPAGSCVTRTGRCNRSHHDRRRFCFGLAASESGGPTNMPQSATIQN